MSIERRMTASQSVTLEKRADNTQTVVGYGAVFYRATDPGTQYRLWEGVQERIAPGAFDRAIKEMDDARALFNHDPNMLLGRVSAKTMRLSVDSVGLRYEIDLPDTQVGRDTANLITRGDLSGSSFSFAVDAEAWHMEGEGDKRTEIRTINSVRLYDVGPVTFPAYESTTTGMRSGDCSDARQSYEKWKTAQVPYRRNIAERMQQLSDLT
jgi:HK97 family phage prohead protease